MTLNRCLPLQLQIGFAALTSVTSHAGDAFIGHQGIGNLTYGLVEVGLLLVPATIGGGVCKRPDMDGLC